MHIIHHQVNSVVAAVIFISVLPPFWFYCWTLVLIFFFYCHPLNICWSVFVNPYCTNPPTIQFQMTTQTKVSMELTKVRGSEHFLDLNLEQNQVGRISCWGRTDNQLAELQSFWNLQRDHNVWINPRQCHSKTGPLFVWSLNVPLRASPPAHIHPARPEVCMLG